jgi:NADH-quinone oxidoreductase subunit N
MTVGNLLAIPQTDVRRLLGYSGVAQMGTVLVAIASRSAEAQGAALFYLASYVFANMGAFFVLHAVADAGGGHELAGLNGLWRRAPALALALLFFLLSLAGIPFVVGFWAKLYVFMAAFRAGQYALVVAGTLLAVVGLFYYLQVARAATMTEATETTPPRVGPWLGAAIVVCFAAVIGLGLFPRPLTEAAAAAGAALSSLARSP